MLASPTSPGAHQYLPAFLLGESTPHTLSVSANSRSDD